MKKIVFFIFAIIAVLISAVFVLLERDKKFDNIKINTKKENNFITTQQETSNMKKLEVPAICQYPELPTGCESVAAAMVLQYCGENIVAEDFASGWLECSENFYTANNQLYGPDPNEVFAGNPFSDNAYGCYATAIVKAVNENSAVCKAKKIMNKTVAQLCEEYIKNDKPILIWATMGMKESKNGKSWYLQNGERFTWIAGEHCLVLVGYDEEYYFLNDPQSGSTVAFQKNIVEKRFKELGMQAVYIYTV